MISSICLHRTSKRRDGDPTGVFACKWDFKITGEARLAARVDIPCRYLLVEWFAEDWFGESKRWI
jgi:hypothetical protein